VALIRFNVEHSVSFQAVLGSFDPNLWVLLVMLPAVELQGKPGEVLPMPFQKRFPVPVSTRVLGTCCKETGSMHLLHKSSTYSHAV